MPTTRFTLLLCSILVLFPASLAQAEGKIDLSTPEAAIMTFCTAQDRETKDAVICCGVKLDGQFTPFRDCTIVQVGPAEMDEEAVTSAGPIRPDDVEIITEVTERHYTKGDVRRRFWYMLRNFAGEWKIITWYYIPDENFPDIPT